MGSIKLTKLLLQTPGIFGSFLFLYSSMKNILIFVVFCIFASCGTVGELPPIVNRPIQFGEERQELSLEYMKDRYGIIADRPVIEPKMVVIHWTAMPTLEESFKAFDPVRLPGSRGDIQDAGALNVSAHFLVDRDGTIYRLMPETTMARHVIGLNHVAIGVENVGGTEETPLTDAQLKSNIYLVKYLSNKYPVEHVIGHYEYLLFQDHPLWLEKDDNYRTEKTDPGKGFMEEIRKKISNKRIKPLPGV